MGAQVSMQTVGIMAVWLETLLYGMYASLFVQTFLIILKKNKTDSGPSKMFFGAIILMFLVATVHISVNLHRVMNAYVYEVDTIGPAAYLSSLTRWDNVLQSSLNAVMTWIGDGLVIYRCYIVWNDNIYIVILPILMLMMSFIANIIVLYRFSHLGQVTIFSVSLVRWINTIYALAFLQNTLTTGLIAYRVYAHDSRSHGLVAVNQVSLAHLARIMVESASLYVLNMLIVMILYAVGSNVQFVAQDAIVPVCGIVFTFMTVRFAMAAEDNLSPTQTDHTTIKFGPYMKGATPGEALSRASPARPMRAIHMGELQDNVWDGDGKYGVPLDEMFPGHGHGHVEKKRSAGSGGDSMGRITFNPAPRMDGPHDDQVRHAHDRDVPRLDLHGAVGEHPHAGDAGEANAHDPRGGVAG